MLRQTPRVLSDTTVENARAVDQGRTLDLLLRKTAMAKAKPVPWPDRLINWCRSYPIASAIVFVIGLVGGGWTVGHNLYQVIARNADIDARLKGFETALSGVDTRINNSVTDATKHSQEDINKRFATLEARFETDHRTSDYLNRMAAHSCKLDYDGMLRVYDIFKGFVDLLHT
jgi:hypothetical protein